jgi:CheY-like chemotaxis protein
LFLKSSPGIGTTAEIWLPAVGATSIEAGAPIAPATGELAASNDRLTILAVDDDALILMSTVDMLEDLGHTVVAADSGKEALIRLETMKFDLMVTDHAMPHMTGAQLVAEVQSRFPGMAVLLATGYAELPPGANVDVLRLAKPFSQCDLADALAKAKRALAAG